jgi:hypothetical protein
VKVADALLPLWRPLAWKVSFRPGIVEPANPPGTAKEAATWPPVMALVVVSTVAPKATSTCSEGANPRQERVTREPAGPLFGETAHLALVGLAMVVVAVPADSAVERVVGRVVGTDDGAEEAGAAVWSAVRELQPVTARVVTKTAVAMIRTGRMATPSNDHDPVGPGHQPRLSRSQHGHRWASRYARTGLGSVAMLHPTKHAAHCSLGGCALGGILRQRDMSSPAAGSVC